MDKLVDTQSSAHSPDTQMEDDVLVLVSICVADAVVIAIAVEFQIWALNE